MQSPVAAIHLKRVQVEEKQGREAKRSALFVSLLFCMMLGLGHTLNCRGSYKILVRGPPTEVPL